MIPHPQRETPVSPQDTVPLQWSQATKIGFRLAFSYFLLYIGPGAVGSLGSYRTVAEVEGSLWSKIWHPIVPWVGQHILQVSGNFAEVPNGSGDQLYDYVLIFCMFITAILITAIWTGIDRKRPNYQQLYLWLRVFMRLVVAWAMLGYGIKKLLGAQFPAPDLVRLIEPFGKATPIGMLWTFMGASWLYSFFGGCGETFGGVLLLFPRLTTLGALVSGAMMTNVLMLNLCYDVPRKILSLHLVLMCLFLLIPDFRRLTNVLILNHRADPVPQIPLFEDKQLNRIALVAQVAFGAYVLWVAGAQSIKDMKDSVSLSGPVRGVWSVSEFVEDGIVHLPLMTDSARWQTVVFDNPKVFTVVGMDGKRTQYFMHLDDAHRIATLSLPSNPKRTMVLTLQNPDEDQLTLDGEYEGHHVSAKMKRVNMSDPIEYPLANKGLHWINPYVDNY